MKLCDLRWRPQELISERVRKPGKGYWQVYYDPESGLYTLHRTSDYFPAETGLDVLELAVWLLDCKPVTRKLTGRWWGEPYWLSKKPVKL